MARLVTSRPSDGWDVSLDLGEDLGFFSHIVSNSGDRPPCRGHTKSDFTVDEGKEWLDLSRKKI